MLIVNDGIQIITHTSLSSVFAHQLSATFSSTPGDVTLLTFISNAGSSGNTNLEPTVPVCYCMAATASGHIYHHETQLKGCFSARTHNTHRLTHAHTLSQSPKEFYFCLTQSQNSSQSK